MFSPCQLLIHPGDCTFIDPNHFFVCSESPTWKRLNSHTLATHERISLIKTIFLDHSQASIVRHLSGGDAQAFIDMIDEVSSPMSKGQVIDFDLNLHILSIRHFIASYHRFAQVVCTIYTVFVVPKPCFQDHWKSHFATTQWNTHCVLVDFQMCGRGNTRAKRLRLRSGGYL